MLSESRSADRCITVDVLADVSSNIWVPLRHGSGNGWKDILDGIAIGVLVTQKECRPKKSATVKARRKVEELRSVMQAVGNSSCDSRFSSPSHTSKPEDRFTTRTFCPRLYSVESVLLGTREAPSLIVYNYRVEDRVLNIWDSIQNADLLTVSTCGDVTSKATHIQLS